MDLFDLGNFGGVFQVSATDTLEMADLKTDLAGLQRSAATAAGGVEAELAGQRGAA
jgi:hypothetical protein